MRIDCHCVITYLAIRGKNSKDKRFDIDKTSPFFFLLALQPPSGVVFYSPLAGFNLLACEVS